jgi:hypothetical protein
MQLQEKLEQVEHIREAIASEGPIDVLADWQALLVGSWKARGFRARVPGLPLAYARRAGCPQDPAELHARVFGTREWQGARAWRRKLLHFPADSLRPPFYGSFSRPRCALCRSISMQLLQLQARYAHGTNKPVSTPL